MLTELIEIAPKTRWRSDGTRPTEGTNREKRTLTLTSIAIDKTRGEPQKVLMLVADVLYQEGLVHHNAPWEKVVASIKAENPVFNGTIFEEGTKFSYTPNGLSYPDSF